MYSKNFDPLVYNGFSATNKETKEEIAVGILTENEDIFLDIVLEFSKEWEGLKPLSEDEFSSLNRQWNSDLNPYIEFRKTEKEIVKTQIVIQHREKNVQSKFINRREYWADKVNLLQFLKP